MTPSDAGAAESNLKKSAGNISIIVTSLLQSCEDGSFR